MLACILAGCMTANADEAYGSLFT